LSGQQVLVFSVNLGGSKVTKKRKFQRENMQVGLAGKIGKLLSFIFRFFARGKGKNPIPTHVLIPIPGTAHF
jgi:hypothetical protein